MSHWQTMFQAAQNLVRAGGTGVAGLRRAVDFARDNCRFLDPSYWSRVESHDWRDAMDSVTRWAQGGLEKIAPGVGWAFVLLDLGDCPELFHLYSPGGQSLMSEPKVRELLLNQPVFEYYTLLRCCSPDSEAQVDALFGSQQTEHIYRNTSWLDDNMLSWKDGSSRRGYQGNNGYFLWLAVGSLALVAPLQDVNFCKRILGGRDRLYLVVGFEQIFTYLATVTPVGIQYEATEPSADEPGHVADPRRDGTTPGSP